MRRIRDRYEQFGVDALVDRRGGCPRTRRVPRRTVAEVCRLKQAVYADFSMKHFHEVVTEKHKLSLIYTLLRSVLQDAGLVEKAPGRGKYRRRGYQELRGGEQISRARVRPRLQQALHCRADRERLGVCAPGRDRPGSRLVGEVRARRRQGSRRQLREPGAPATSAQRPTEPCVLRRDRAPDRRRNARGGVERPGARALLSDRGPSSASPSPPRSRSLTHRRKRLPAAQLERTRPRDADGHHKLLMGRTCVNASDRPRGDRRDLQPGGAVSVSILWSGTALGAAPFWSTRKTTSEA